MVMAGQMRVKRAARIEPMIAYCAVVARLRVMASVVSAVMVSIVSAVVSITAMMAPMRARSMAAVVASTPMMAVSTNLVTVMAIEITAV